MIRKKSSAKLLSYLIPDRSNLDSSEPKSDVLPVTPSGIGCAKVIIITYTKQTFINNFFSSTSINLKVIVRYFTKFAIRQIIYKMDFKD